MSNGLRSMILVYPFEVELCTGSGAVGGHHLGSLDPGPPALAIPAFDVEAVDRMHAGVDLEDEEGAAPEAVGGGEDDLIAGLDCVLHGPSISFRGGTLHRPNHFFGTRSKLSRRYSSM